MKEMVYVTEQRAHPTDGTNGLRELLEREREHSSLGEPVPATPVRSEAPTMPPPPVMAEPRLDEQMTAEQTSGIPAVPRPLFVDEVPGHGTTQYAVEPAHDTDMALTEPVQAKPAVQTDPVADEPTEPELQRHPDEPTQGWPTIQSALYRSRMCPNSLREHPEHPGYFRFAPPNQTEYRVRLIKRLKKLSDMGIMPVMCFELSKSTAKTTSSIGVGNVVSWYTQRRSLIIPSTANTETATLGLMAGIVGNGITVSEFMANSAEYGTHRTLEKRLPLTRWGLGVIFEDEDSDVDEDDKDKTKQFMQMVDTILPNLGGTLILDGGNDNISRWSIALQAARLAHVLNHPFVVDKPVSYAALSKTMRKLHRDTGEIPEDVLQELYGGFTNTEDTGLSAAVSAKVSESVVIATGSTTGVDFQSVASCDKQIPWSGTGVYVPDEPSFARRNGNEVVPIDMNDISRRTEIGYLEIAVANFELTGLRMGMDVGDLMVANAPTNS